MTSHYAFTFLGVVLHLRGYYLRAQPPLCDEVRRRVRVPFPLAHDVIKAYIICVSIQQSTLALALQGNVSAGHCVRTYNGVFITKVEADGDAPTYWDRFFLLAHIPYGFIRATPALFPSHFAIRCIKLAHFIGGAVGGSALSSQRNPQPS